MPGLTGDGQRQYARNIIGGAIDKYDTVVINFRGLAGAKLVTPKLYTSYSYKDVGEAVKYLRERYPVRRFFAVGLSMGGNVLANLFGLEQPDIDAAVIVQTPLKFDKETVYNTLYGLYNY